MADLELTRTADDRRAYALKGVGRLRLRGLLTRTAIAEADGARWTFRRGGLWRQVVEATDATDTAVGEFQARGLRRGGTLRWAGRELTLRAASNWRERYALADGDRELAVFDGKGWGRRPVKLTTEDAEQLDPGLVLFTAFVVRGLAKDAGSSAGGVTAATGSSS